MKHGDISNVCAPCVGISITSIVKQREQGWLKRVLKAKPEYSFDAEALMTAWNIFNRTDMSCALIVPEDKKDYLKVLSEDDLVPYNPVFHIRKPHEVFMLLFSSQILYYLDNDEIMLGMVGHKGAMTVKRFNDEVMR